MIYGILTPVRPTPRRNFAAHLLPINKGVIMKRHSRVFIVAAIAAVLAACAATQTKAPITGNTHAGATLKADVARNISMQAQTQLNCQKVDAIQTEVVKVNPVGTGSSAASRQYGSVDERWIVQLCNQQIPFRVTLTPDGKGGTYFSTSRETY
ncbi:MULTISPECIES: hypothetical protein [Achromobacter]|uniref:Lipoprotein n=1 Tax=Achromobacter spanius TaxID=217203 RepID=A0ABY8GLT1_9BURK|nr:MULTISPECIES: hypothetical protein [Achromobacter]WAI85118.1 hypothetical protein N8Z00_08595 [Achromobacter spanius]WEX95200.1 hypothetical protein N3Z32_03185 [Achromobacter sp. SS2-2022]WFP05630.1 hypothetical protein P8T11_14895 [Achromobacter spanius]